MLISLNSVDKVKSFVNKVSQFDEEIDLVSGRYVVDAKSLLGIFSLDLSKPIELETNGIAKKQELEALLKDYCI
ncbi:MAG: HPr family phosphocarrier protein [bacterium]|nr:HPr family phosphocarrier protein [bacterium]